MVLTAAATKTRDVGTVGLVAKTRRKTPVRPARVIQSQPEHAPPTPEESVGEELADHVEDEIEARARRAQAYQGVCETLIPSAVLTLGSDADPLLQRLDLVDQRRLTRAAGIKLEPRYMRGGIGPALRRVIPHLDQDGLRTIGLLVAGQIGEPLHEEVEWPDADTETVADLIDRLDSEYGRSMTTVWIVVHGSFDADASELLAGVLASRFTGPAADTGAQDGTDDTADDEEDVADDVALFDALDRLMIRTVIASRAEQPGAPTPDEMRQIIDQLVRLNMERRSSYFHAGFLTALDDGAPEPPAEVMNEERRRTLLFGKLTGLSRLNATSRLIALTLDQLDDAEAVLSDVLTSRSVLSPVIRALVVDHPDIVADLLGTTATGAIDADLAFDDVYERARCLLADGDADLARRIFDGLRRHVDDAAGSTRLTTVIGTNALEIDADLRRRVASCHRAAGNFDAAGAQLDRIPEDVTADVSAAVLAERGMVAARVGHLKHLSFPRSPDERDALIERLQRGREDFDAALVCNPRELRACYARGLLAYAAGDVTAAAVHLERALTASSDDQLLGGVFTDALRFHQALAQLETAELGVDGPAYSAAKDALMNGYDAPSADIVRFAEALDAVGSPLTGSFLELAVERSLSPALLASVVTRRARAGDAAAIRAAEALVKGTRVHLDERFELLISATVGAGAAGRAAVVESYVERIDELVAGACKPELDRQWASLLARDVALRELIGPASAEAQRIEILRRIGAHAEACAIAVDLFHRSVSETIQGFFPKDLLGLLEELDYEQELVADLERRLPLEPQTTCSDVPATILFIGGNEKQAAYKSELEADLRTSFGDAVTVEWHFPGWSSNWFKIVDRVEPRLTEFDALVLMTFVRTNLGRRMRAAAGSVGLPWISCTGHGRQSLLRSVERAVQVARSR